MITFRSFSAVVLAIAGSLPGAGPAPAVASGPHTVAGYGEPAPQVVMRGLANPRGLAFGPRGELYVAEAGRGGAGAPGAITVAEFGHQWRVVPGLPSAAPPSGAGAGPNDVAVGDDLLYTAGPAGEPGLYRGRSLLARVANPVAVLATARGHLVVDAAAGALLRVTARGRIQTVAIFPRRTVTVGATRFVVDPAPSSVVAGPDGAVYVGERTGYPFPAGAARIWRVEPGREPRVLATGLTAVTDLAWSPDGHLYVLESGRPGARSGALLRLGPRGTRTVIAGDGLPSPAGLAIRGRNTYISTCSTCNGSGAVVRLPL